MLMAVLQGYKGMSQGPLALPAKSRRFPTASSQGTWALLPQGRKEHDKAARLGSRMGFYPPLPLDAP